MKNKAIYLFSAIYMTVVPVLFSSFWLVYVLQNEAIIQSFGQTQWFFLLLGIMLATALALVPPTFLAVVLGYFWGWTSLLPLFGLNLGAIGLIFIFTKALDKDSFLSYLSENQKVKTIIQKFRADEWQVIFFTKLSPVLPFALTNLTFSLLGTSLRNMIIGGGLGMIPRTILAVWTGSQAKALQAALQHPNQGFTSQLILLALIVFSFWGMGYFMKKYWKD